MRLGERFDAFDRDAIDRITGTSTPQTRSISVDAAWEESFLAVRARGQEDVLGTKNPQETGLLEKLRELGAEEDLPISSASDGKGVARGSGLFGGITDVASRVSAWIERMVFDRFHGGVARTGGSFGAALYQIEDFLGRPAVLGVTVIVVIGGIILGVLS